MPAPLSLPLAACLCAFAPLTALAADCVTADQVKAGLRIDYRDGGRVVVRLLANGLVELREAGTAEGGGDLRFLSRFGVYDLEASLAADGENAADHRVIYDYGGQPLLEPAVGGTGWVGPVTANFPDGEVEEQTAAYVFGAEETLALAGCSYDAVPVEATFLRQDGWEGQRFLFFPALAFAVLVGRSGPDQDRSDFPIVAIAPAGG